MDDQVNRPSTPAREANGKAPERVMLETHPPKAISPARDRFQSRLLVWIILPILAALCIRIVFTAVTLVTYAPRRRYFLAELAISVAFALFAWILKSATPAAAACGAIVCLLLTDCTYSSPSSLLHSGLPPLIALFVLTFLATRFGRAKKESRGLSEPRAGRQASQVIANLGVAAICAAFCRTHVMLESTFAYGATIAALAEATADTLSSEIGQAIAGPTILITILRRVAPGTDGAISLAGTGVGILGAAVVVYAALPHPFWSATPLIFAAIFAAAIGGLLFDSLLGATVERKGWLGNDLVNFSSTAFSAAAVYPLAFLAMPFLHV